MKDLLKTVPPGSLYSAVGSDELVALGRIVESDFDPESLKTDSEKLSNFVMAYLGHRVLDNRQVRELVLELLPIDLLRELVESFGGRIYSKAGDNALVLAKRPWKHGSRLVRALRTDLGVDWEYLPSRSSKPPSCEFIEPVEELPPLLDYQQSVKGQILAELRDQNQKSRFLVQMPTGAGKTRTVLEAAIEYLVDNSLFESGKSLCWLAHTEELCEQAIDTFKDIWRHTGSSTVRIVRLWGNYDASDLELEGAFVVAGVAKLWRYIDSSDSRVATVAAATEVVVIDEAHKSTAPTYRACIDALQGKTGSTVIGLSATPGRGQGRAGENKALASLFGENLVRPDLGPNPLERLRSQGVLARLERESVESHIDVKVAEGDVDEFDVSTRLLKRLAESASRNRLLVGLIRREVERGNPALVFACTVQHAKLISAALNLLGCSSAFVDCRMDRGSRRAAVEGFRNGNVDVLINFGVLSTGFDAPRTRAVIIARPTSSIVLYSQMIGRGLRGPKMGGTASCRLIDIRDNFRSFGDVDAVYEAFSSYWS